MLRLSTTVSSAYCPEDDVIVSGSRTADLCSTPRRRVRTGELPPSLARCLLGLSKPKILISGIPATRKYRIQQTNSLEMSSCMLAYHW